MWEDHKYLEVEIDVHNANGKLNALADQGKVSVTTKQQKLHAMLAWGLTHLQALLGAGLNALLVRGYFQRKKPRRCLQYKKPWKKPLQSLINDNYDSNPCTERICLHLHY